MHSLDTLLLRIVTRRKAREIWDEWLIWIDALSSWSSSSSHVNSVSLCNCDWMVLFWKSTKVIIDRWTREETKYHLIRRSRLNTGKRSDFANISSIQSQCHSFLRTLLEYQHIWRMLWRWWPPILINGQFQVLPHLKSTENTHNF